MCQKTTVHKVWPNALLHLRHILSTLYLVVQEHKQAYLVLVVLDVLCTKLIMVTGIVHLTRR